MRRIFHPACCVFLPILKGKPETGLHGNRMVGVLIGERLPVNQIVHSRTICLVHNKRSAKQHLCGNLLLRSAVLEFLLRKLAQSVLNIVFLQNYLGYLLLLELCIDKFKYVRMVGIHHNHASRPASLSAGLYRPSHSIPASVVRQWPRRSAFPRDRLALTPYGRYVYPHSGSASKNSTLCVLVAEYGFHRIFHAQYEARAHLWICIIVKRPLSLYISVLRLLPIIGYRTLVSKNFSQIRPSPAPLLPMTNIEPNRAVRRPYLMQEHIL